MIGARASQNAIINQIMSKANGIGKSKEDAQKNSQIKGQNGQAVSTKNHSIKSTQNMRSVTTQYVSFVKENYQGRASGNLTSETMKDFINSKIDEGLAMSSVNTYISALGKISDNLNELGISSTSRDEITAYRSEIKETHGTMQSANVDRAYENAQQIVDAMQNTPFGLSSELQHQAGLRANDAINITQTKDENGEITNGISINNDNTLTIHQSKNGLTYQTRELPQELLDKVSTVLENGGQRSEYNEYKDAMKEEVQMLGQDWQGTHGLRYNYAQEQIQEGKSREEVSLEMGHSREGITEHYLAQK